MYSRVECERVREHSRVRAHKLACHSLARVTLPVICTVYTVHIQHQVIHLMQHEEIH